MLEHAASPTFERGADQARPHRGAASSGRSLFPVLLGNWFEFFDFGVYAFFAVMIGKAFFPATSASGQLLLSVGTFGVGFVVRPLGGVVLGAYADRAGRKAALSLTIWLMALGTGALGLTPSYAQIGLAAPCIIVLARLLQGFSAGGEVGAATTYLLELAPAGQRGLYGSGQYATQALATFCASALGFGLSSVLSAEQMGVWGFRIPFLAGTLIGPLGFFLRRNLDETKGEGAESRTTRELLSTLRREHLGLILTGVLTISGGTVSVYIVGKYMTTYALHTLHLPANLAFLASLAAGGVGIVGAILGGYLSDRLGRRIMMLAPRAALVLATYPAFLLITTRRSSGSLVAMVGVLAFLQAAGGGVTITALPECFPRAIRTSGLSITYALGVTIFGGSAQLIATWLLDVTGRPMSIAWYLIAANLVTLLATFRLHPPDERAPLD